MNGFLVIFGQGHIPVCKHLLESNPDFEAEEVKDVFKVIVWRGIKVC